MTDETFKTGDMVQLKTGGPMMTVGNTEAYAPYLICTWFAGNTLTEHNFLPAMLQRAEPTPPPNTDPRRFTRGG